MPHNSLRSAAVHRPMAFSLAALAFVAALASPSFGAILNADAGFENQTLGSFVDGAWNPNNGFGNVVTAGASSPYVNVFSGSTRGVNTPATADNPLFSGPTLNAAQTAPLAIPASSTAPLYVNVDFRNNPTGVNPIETGDYSIVVTNNTSPAQRTLAVYISGTAVYAEDGNALTNDLIASFVPTIGQWYNLQLTLDMGAKTYSGAISTNSASVQISSRSFVNAANPISTIYTDGTTNRPGSVAAPAPNHDLDNFAISSTPLAPVPEPTCVTLIAIGGVILTRRRWAR